jgi:hypothetical protein
MNHRRTASRRKSGHGKATRLVAYLTAGTGPALLATSAADASIIAIDVGPWGLNIAGVNGGVAPGGMRMEPFPTASQYWLGLFNDYTNGYFSILGISMGPSAGVAITGAAAAPRNFTVGEIIDVGATFTSGFYDSMFRVQTPYQTALAPDFGPNSFLGFRSSGGNYGWLEVSWDQTTAEFQILAAAYESQVGTGIAAGHVPEPATGALAALALGGAAYAEWRRRRATKAKRSTGGS